MTNLSSRTYDEKRDFIRMKVDTEICITVGDTSKQLVGYCRDLSGTGMLIEVPEAVTEGITCKTQLQSSSAAFPALDASIKILRCTQLDDELFQLGVEIMQIES